MPVKPFTFPQDTCRVGFDGGGDQIVLEQSGKGGAVAANSGAGGSVPYDHHGQPQGRHDMDKLAAETVRIVDDVAAHPRFEPAVSVFVA